MGEVLIQEKLIKDELPATDMQGFADLEDGVLICCSQMLNVNILSPIFCFQVIDYPNPHWHPSNHENTPRIFSLISMIVDYKKKEKNQ